MAIQSLVAKTFSGLLLPFRQAFCQIPEGKPEGVGGACYILKRHLMPRGCAVARHSQHCSQKSVFPPAQGPQAPPCLFTPSFPIRKLLGLQEMCQKIVTNICNKGCPFQSEISTGGRNWSQVRDLLRPEVTAATLAVGARPAALTVPRSQFPVMKVRKILNW